MRFEDICEDMAVRYVGCPPSVLGEDPLLAGTVTARWPASFRVTFAHRRSYRYNTVAADMFEPLVTGCDRTPRGGVTGAGATGGGSAAAGSAGRPVSVAARRPVTRREHLRRPDRRAPDRQSPRPTLTAPPPRATRSLMEDT
jgi:hypothetical protein